MKRVSYLVALSVLAALILGLIAIVPASAETPYQEKGTLEYDFPYSTCGFDAQAHVVMNFHRILYYDRNGADRSDSGHAGGSTISITYDDHQLTARNSENTRIEWLNFYDAIYEIAGTSWIITVPGHGAVMGTIGRQTVLESCYFDENEQWKCNYTLLHLSGITFNDQEAVCDYLLNGN